MRKINDIQKPVRATLKKDEKLLRALFRILAAHDSKHTQPAGAESPRGADEADDLEWTLRMMS